jgi:hypothetical protein
MSMTREPGESYKAFVVRAAMNPIARAVKFADIADNVTEARLALLEPDTAHHLREKYAEGRRLLEGTASKDYTGIDFDSLLAEGKQIGWSTQFCVECGHPAGTIEIIDEEETTQVDKSVIPLSIYCHLGTASIFIDSALAERCLSALNANDMNYLYELNPEICPWWCSKCGQSYCVSSWSTPSKSDNGYVDFISGECPRGHFRKFWD